MAIEYSFYCDSDDKLIETSELPVEDGIAVAVRTTGYEPGSDEIVELSIVDFAGKELFSQTVKPQNKSEWDNNEASGGITPADVEDAPELYQFEDEIRELFENASIAVGQHIDFIREMIEASWVALPPFESFDLVEQFRESHSTVDYPGQNATVADLEGIAAYYGLSYASTGTLITAQTVAACYIKLVEEHAAERLGKGAEYWQEYQRKLEEAERNDEKLQDAKRINALKTTRINAILWLCAAAIFANLSVQFHIRAFDTGLVAVAAIAAVFFAIRWIMCLHAMYKLRKR